VCCGTAAGHWPSVDGSRTLCCGTLALCCCGTAAGHWPCVDVGLCVVVQQRDIGPVWMDLGLCVVVHWPCVVVVQQRDIDPVWI